ncbi:uncharacterized protein LOC109795741 [Cajanus cajan]|uniref:uncharacterized protein LOC109795741 n=1 Tax=Cajanus cajan TaxID=3821 RepID=UPI00098D78A9|nr:uncharacterized protein LOC109795741 [Cajanus cajan]
MDLQSWENHDYSNAFFEGAVRVCEETVKIPTSFYNTWGNELSKKVILEDNYGNIFLVDIVIDIINNKVSAKFGNGINCLKAFYNIKVGTLLHFKYVGKDTFKIRFSINETPSNQFIEFQPRRQVGSASRTRKANQIMLWESRIFHEQRPFWKSLIIPTNVVETEFTNQPSTIIVKLPNNMEEDWDIIWCKDKRPNSRGFWKRLVQLW